MDAGIIGKDAPLTVNAISGYSGGGKGLIEIFQSDDHEPWGAYGYSMVSVTGLFCRKRDSIPHYIILQSLIPHF